MARRAHVRPTPPRPRAAWKGTLVFGLVNIPVSLQRAVAQRGVLLHELHDHDGGRIRRRAVCATCSGSVTHDHIVKGFEVERGRWVTLSSDELHALDPAASRAVSIVAFVDPREIDPIFYGQTYWLVPDDEAARPYALLAAAMAGLGRAAIARLTMRARQHLCLIRPAHDHEGRVLALTTLGYADEILPAVGVPGPARAEVPANDRELALAERLIDVQSGHFEAEGYHDERREQILAYLQHKAEGARPAASPEAEPAPQGDLRGALEASLAEAQHKTAA